MMWIAEVIEEFILQRFADDHARMEGKDIGLQVFCPQKYQDTNLACTYCFWLQE